MTAAVTADVATTTDSSKLQFVIVNLKCNVITFLPCTFMFNVHTTHLAAANDNCLCLVWYNINSQNHNFVEKIWFV